MLDKTRRLPRVVIVAISVIRHIYKSGKRAALYFGFLGVLIGFLFPSTFNLPYNDILSVIEGAFVGSILGFLNQKLMRWRYRSFFENAE